MNVTCRKVLITKFILVMARAKRLFSSIVPKPGRLVQFLNVPAPSSSYNIKKIDFYKRTM